jgi:hypothetical protein
VIFSRSCSSNGSHSIGVSSVIGTWKVVSRLFVGLITIRTVVTLVFRRVISGRWISAHRFIKRFPMHGLHTGLSSYSPCFG